MRHLGSIVLSLLIAPIVYALAGVGMVKMTALHGPSGTNWRAAAIAVTALAGAGLLYAVLVLARLSPLGPIAAGIALAGATVWFQFRHASFVHHVPANALRVPQAAWAPAGAVAMLLAVPLFATVFSPRRWRRWGEDSGLGAVGAYQPPAFATATTAYAAPSAWPVNDRADSDATRHLP
jgi:hypothetical protein